MKNGNLLFYISKIASDGKNFFFKWAFHCCTYTICLLGCIFYLRFVGALYIDWISVLSLLMLQFFFSTYHLIIDFVYDVLSYRILYCYIISAVTLCCYGFWFFFLLKAFHTQMIKIVSIFSSNTLISFTKSLNPSIICCYT